MGSDFLDRITDDSPIVDPRTFEHRPMTAIRMSDPPSWVEEFNRVNSWTDILEGDGWTLAYTDGDGVEHWVRPGKSRREGTSATVNYAGLDCLHVYTTSISWLPSDRMFDKYGYVVQRDHHGDFKAAAQALKPASPKTATAAQRVDLLGPGVPTNVADATADDPGVLAALEIDFSPDGPFWNADESPDEWLIPDFVARGRGHALYAGAKTGKSFVALDAIAAAAIPRHEAWTNLPTGADRITVVYLDYEMTDSDVRERLEGFGYGPEDDYSRFHYVRAMAFGFDLDTHEGGSELLAYALARNADLVVVDTLSRAVRGDENDADTVRHFYQSTGGLLKAKGIALLRLDHAGKTADKGQRGSSGKNDDVDVVWKLERTDAGSALTCTHKRMAWIPDKVNILTAEVDGIVTLRRAATDEMWPAGTKAKAAEADALGLPTDATRDRMKAAGMKGATTVLQAAVRFRKQQSERSFLSAGQ
jgi:hypothetical protein